MKKISVVTSCYNEELNLDELYARLTKQFEILKDKYEFECILADNASTDHTADKLREMAAKDKRFKVILNSRNFGHLKSPFHALRCAQGEAAILIASDLQDPPELIGPLLEKWEEGNQVVLLQKVSSQESKLMFLIRKFYYFLITKMADNGVELAMNCTGEGLVDKRIIEVLREIDDPYPYYRGLVCEAGFNRAYVPFEQPSRQRGITANNFYTLYDLAMTGFVKNTKIPLRIMALTGFAASLVTFLIAIFYLVWKLVYWNTFSMGIAPIIIGMMFLGSIQLFCLGVLGEYIAAIYTRVDKKPLVIEKERINF